MENELLFSNLTFKLNGIFFDVHNKLGQYCNEKQYCDIIEQLLKQKNILYEREKILPPSFENERPGRNRIDFIVDRCVIIEVKAKQRIERNDYDQLMRYLMAMDKKLGMLVNFREREVKIKRVLNPHSNYLSDTSVKSAYQPNPHKSVNPCLIKIKKLRPDVKLPSYAHPGDVGMDLLSQEDYTLQPGERKIFPLGFALEFDIGYAAIVKDKSSLPKNGGVHVMGGVYDAGYRGEYNVQLINLGQEPFKIEKGNKIAQLVIFPVAIAALEEVDELSDSSRGAGRFGSTGR